MSRLPHLPRSRGTVASRPSVGVGTKPLHPLIFTPNISAGITENSFWRLIDAARILARRRWRLPPDRRLAAALTRLLATLPPKDIVRFQDIFNTQMLRANEWHILQTAALIEGGISDDGFEYFRAYLIGQGQDVFERALVNPDILAEAVTEAGADNEHLLYSAMDAHEIVTGTWEMPLTVTGRTGALPSVPPPSGTPWTVDEIPGHLPRLWARFGARAATMDWFPRLAA